MEEPRPIELEEQIRRMKGRANQRREHVRQTCTTNRQMDSHFSRPRNTLRHHYKFGDRVTHCKTGNLQLVTTDLTGPSLRKPLHFRRAEMMIK